MRFVAPDRATVAARQFSQPIFAGLDGFRELLLGPIWPDLTALNSMLQPLEHSVTGGALALLDQETIDDQENYERRIFERGLIATRSGNWHDLLNAIVWKIFPAIKSALNAGQCEDMARVGLQQRTRRQCAFTQFDEAGAVLVLRQPHLLALWDSHDWDGLFLKHRDAWTDGSVTLKVFGHALYEHALNPDMLLVSKTVVVDDPQNRIAGHDIDGLVSDAITAGMCLGDPQQLRPLPLSGIPGWSSELQDAAFYRDQPCFRPLRTGRRYPLPLNARINASAFPLLPSNP
jgi:hypothetical protein